MAAMPRGFVEGYMRAISSLVPPDIMSQAQGIVATHRPEGLPEGFEPLCMAGLKPKDHEYLNGVGTWWTPIEERRKIYAEKRSEYAGNPVALQQIDVYDGETFYHDKFSELRDALISGNSTKEAELIAWFKEHYPDIK